MSRGGVACWMVIFACVLLGCAQPSVRYEPPLSDTGRLCTAQCDVVREACEANELTQRRMACRADPEECDVWNDVSDEDKCVKRHRSCFRACGGRVIEG